MKNELKDFDGNKKETIAEREMERPLETLISILDSRAVSPCFFHPEMIPKKREELERLSRCASSAKNQITLGLAAIGELLWLSTVAKGADGYEFERLGDVGCLIQTLAETLHELDQLQQDADFAIKTPRPFVVGA